MTTPRLQLKMDRHKCDDAFFNERSGGIYFSGFLAQEHNIKMYPWNVPFDEYPRLTLDLFCEVWPALQSCVTTKMNGEVQV